ncbi:MAG: catalase [Lachnospiraceae bacterium]|nr:catalase [Lachnospiraceae bacterium]
MNLFEKAKGHITTVLKHKHKVFINCLKAGIPIRGLLHDLSKFSPEELIPSIRYFQGNRSPNEAEREAEGASRAWMHHKGRNKHHFEYWTDYDYKTKKMSPMPMPYLCIVEMFCDRVAASQTYMKDAFTTDAPYNYFALAKGRRVIEKETSDTLERMLIMYRDKGEKETFRNIRHSVYKYTIRQIMGKTASIKKMIKA